MGGITSGIGIFSGINSGQLIEQLLALEARPKLFAQNRLGQIQQQQAAFLDINARMAALRTASAGFREAKTFQTKATTSSNADVLSATADASAAAGSYVFVVDRLVSTQQALTRGFANKDISGLGATKISFESSAARLDRDVELADLNDGQGVARGKMVVTDSLGRAATIDLSRATNVSEVLDAINSNGTAQVSASVKDGRFIIKDNAGGAATVANAQNSTVATGLGLSGLTASGGTLTGNSVYRISGATTLASLNDRNGVSMKQSTTEDSYSFIINVGGASPKTVKVNLGDVYTSTAGVVTKTKGAVADMAGVITRINEAMSAAGLTDISASVDQTNGNLRVTDASGLTPLTVTEGTDTTAADLGLTAAPVGGNLVGRRVLAGMQTTLVAGLKGGGMAANDGVLNFELRNGTSFTTTMGSGEGVQGLLDQIEEDSKVSGVKTVTARLDSNGTGIVISDLTTGVKKLTITGTAAADFATALGISTGPAGTAAASVSSGNMQRQYMSRATLLSGLNSGRGVGTGEFRIIDSFGSSASVRVTDSVKTMGDLMDLINSRGIKVKATINANGDGISIGEALAPGDTAGLQSIKVEEVGSTLAKNLNLLGTATGTGAANKIDGSFERVVTLSAADTLQQITDKINAAKPGVNASIVRDGSGSAGFRLSLTSSSSGTSGRFIVDSGAFDFGMASLDAGRDARVFFGSSDAAAGVAVTSSTNSIDSVLAGVKIDLKAASATPVNLTVASDSAGIEKAVATFIQTFNTAVDRIEFQTKYDKESNRKSPLLGDGTALELRSQLFATVQGRATGATGTYSSLADVGLTVGTGGSLVLDSAKFRTAVATDPASVEAIFAAQVAVDDRVTNLGGGVTVRNPDSGKTFSTLGVLGKIEQLAKKYVDGNNSILFGKADVLRTQVTLQRDRITVFDAKLERKRAILQAQFNAMEAAIGKMQGQQSALSSIQQTG